MFCRINNFNIRVFEKEQGDEFFSGQGKTLFEIKADEKLFAKHYKYILADPFLFVHKDVLFLFYERQDGFWGKGKLCMRKTSDLKYWSSEKDVLVEPFHLSFPNVFEMNGATYMIPECCQDRTVRLYKAVDDSLEKWELASKIQQDGLPHTDSSIYKKDGVYYLFNTIKEDGVYTQHLYTSSNLTGEYTEHPCSPVKKDMEFGRLSGSLIKRDGVLYRPTQSSLHSYGEQVSIFKIDRLSPTEYSETLYKRNILTEDVSYYKYGGHQFNSVVYKGHTIMATDFRTHNYNILITLKRIKLKISSMI